LPSFESAHRDANPNIAPVLARSDRDGLPSFPERGFARRFRLCYNAAVHVFPSAEWAAAYREAVNASEAYRRAGAGWTHGAVALVIKADDAIGLSQPVGIWLDLDRGVCRDARVVSPEEAARAPFCIGGEYARWRQVLNRELEPIAAMMQRKLELKGQMTIIVRFVEAAKELVNAAARIPTRFLGE